MAALLSGLFAFILAVSTVPRYYSMVPSRPCFTFVNADESTQQICPDNVYAGNLEIYYITIISALLG